MSKEKTLRKIEDRIHRMEMHRTHTRSLRLVKAGLLFVFFGAILYLTLGEARHHSLGEVVTEENMHDIADRIPEDPDSADNTFESIMNYTWQFETGASASSNAYVENSAGNRQAFYFTVTLSDPSQTVLYVSPNLKVGEKLNSIRLDKELAAGHYNALLTYCLLNASGNVEDTVQMAIEIIVER